MALLCKITAPEPFPSKQWDIFCRVIDNFGDIGVCWRLACGLADRGQRVRLWADDASALAWMAPQGHAGVQVRAWGSAFLPEEPASEVLIEAFGCEIAPDFIAACAAYTGQARARGQKPWWINLEYLSAERYVERCHALPSPVQQGPAAGWTKWFFYPGFTPATGGLLRELDVFQRQARFDGAAWRSAQISAAGVPPMPAGTRWVSLFCYEPAALPAFLAQCAQATPPIKLLATPGRAAAAVHALNGLQPFPSKPEQLSFLYLPTVPQAAFDEMLWACDVNFVRGEDSLVRALWAGKPLVWQIYPQDDNAHHPKLQAFLDWLQAPASLRQFHAIWNGLIDAPLPELSAEILKEWGNCVQAARARLLEQTDLLSQLIGFCGGQR